MVAVKQFPHVVSFDTLNKGRESATLLEISRNTHEIKTDLGNLGPAQATTKKEEPTTKGGN